MSLFRRKREADESPEPAADAETSAAPPHGDQLREVLDSQPGSAPDAEERAIREAAERAALARLGRAESPPEPALAPQADAFEEDERARQQDDQRVQAEAERRIREVEDAQREAEARAEEAKPAAEERKHQAAGVEAEAARRRAPAERAPAGPEPDASQHPKLLAELRDAQRQLDERPAGEDALARELAETEQRLADNQQRTAEALERAAERLEQVESRAAQAEQRAERAERLAAVKAEEIERAERLRETLDRIAQAEQRASDAEQRARAAVDRVSAPVPEIEAEAVLDRPTAESAGASPETEEPADAQSEPESSPSSPAEGAAAIDLNRASYEQLRGLGLSVTQTGRLLAHRERVGGFSSAKELDGIPGFPQSFFDEFKDRIRV